MVAPIYLGLVDLILAYCYDFRSNLGDESVESHWNICKLSGTLSAFDTFYSLEDVIKCFLRRSVSFPLYRSYDLFLKVLEDAVILFKLGKRYLLQTLLRIKRILACHEATFVIDRIYLTDYAVWIQTASEKKLKSLASELHRFTPSKALSDWNLHELEQESLSRKEECDYPV
jgi:protein SHQ1